MNAKGMVELPRAPRSSEEWRARLIEYGQRIKPLVDEAVRLHSTTLPKYVVAAADSPITLEAEWPDHYVKTMEFIQGEIDKVAKEMGLSQEIDSSTSAPSAKGE